MEETSTGHNNYVELVVKTSLRFDPYPFLFREIFLNLYTMILASSSSGECVDEAVDNRTNYQGYIYIYFFRYPTLTVISFMDGVRVC